MLVTPSFCTVYWCEQGTYNKAREWAALMNFFLGKVTFFGKIFGFTVLKSLVMNGSWLIAGCF